MFLKTLMIFIFVISRAIGLHIDPTKLLLSQDQVSFDTKLNCQETTDHCAKSDNRKVCSTNGKTYKSTCEFAKEYCKHRNFNFSHYGDCTPYEKCQGYRKVSLIEWETAKNEVYVPECKPDGYAPVQCHKGTGFCWCVRLDGTVHTKTAKQHEKPDCSMVNDIPIYDPDANLKPPSEPKGLCAGKKMKKFNENMLRQLDEEFRRNSVKRVTGDDLQKAILTWKFDELDRNRDGYLKRKEYRRLQKIVRGFVEPRSCSKKFPKFCDINQDKKISKMEWIKCFSKTQNKLPDKSSKNGKQKGGKKGQEEVGKFSRPEPCQHDRKQAMEDSANGAKDVYIPSCDDKGFYKPIQCYGNNEKNLWYCFCVNVKSGKMVENTSVRNGSPDCSFISRRKSWPKCMSPQKEAKFLKSLIAYLVKYAATLNRQYGVTSSSSEEAAIYKVFLHLDKNKNKEIDKKERKNLKKIVRKQRQLRECGKKIHIVCDINNDKRISFAELKACILSKTNVNRKSSTRSNGTITERKNPFIEIIKSE